MQSLLVIVLLCLVVGCGSRPPLNEIDPADTTPPILIIDDAACARLNVTYSPDGKRLATATNYIPSLVHVWNAATGQQLLEIETEGHAVMGLEFTSDGCKLVGILQKGSKVLNVNTAPVIIWNSVTGEKLRMFESGYLEADNLIINHDSSLIATSGSRGVEGKFIHLWDIESGELLHELTIENPGLISMKFSPNGKQLAAGSTTDNHLHLWSLPELKLTKIPARNLSCLDISPDGKQIAYGCGQMVRICSVQSGETLFTLDEKRNNRGEKKQTGNPIDGQSESGCIQP